MLIDFTVLGNPKPQSRPRFFKRGNFTQVYDKDAPDKKNFAEVATYNKPEQPYVIPLQVEIHFFMKRPRYHYRTGKYVGQLKPNAPNVHIKKPDLDNLAKFVLDSLNGVYWLDDSYINILTLYKQYDEEPRTYVKIYG